jgi:hypothetical protein
VIKIDPSFAVVYQDRSRVYTILAGTDLAASDAQKASKLGYELWCLVYWRGQDLGKKSQGSLTDNSAMNKLGR